jgi:hypothetical protein
MLQYYIHPQCYYSLLWDAQYFSLVQGKVVLILPRLGRRHEAWDVKPSTLSLSASQATSPHLLDRVQERLKSNVFPNLCA